MISRDRRLALARFWGWRLAHYAFLLLVNGHVLASGTKSGDFDWPDIFGPWADALRFSILKYHQFPWWNPWSMSGQPLFADPQIAVLMPDTLFILAFGAVVGFKLLILFYVFVGYEGSRYLCRQLFGASTFVTGASVIPVLVAPLSMHFGVGHVVFFPFYLFPWLLALSLTWHQSARRALALGAVVGCYLLNYIHYSIIIALTIAGAIVLVRVIRSFRSRDTWSKAALVVCTALAMGLTRIALTGAIVSQFPRVDEIQYPIAVSTAEILRTLVDRLQDRTFSVPGLSLFSWETSSYVGLLVLLLAYEGFRRGDRKLRALHVGALICLALAWNNRDKYLPGYWMHFIAPWKYMIVITRWRLFACFLFLVGAVQGLVAIRRNVGLVTATCLALLVVADLGSNVDHGYEKSFENHAPPFDMGPDPPKAILDNQSETWAHVRMNLVSMGAQSTLLGWGYHPPKRDHIGMPNYRGEFVGTKPVQVESWTPNRITLTASPGDTLTLNINPSNYWVMNGERLFPSYRPFEIEKPFQLVVPPSGRIELVARPPHWRLLALIQSLFAVATILLFQMLRKKEAKKERSTSPPSGHRSHCFSHHPA